MKKIASLLFVALMVLALAACSQQAKPVDQPAGEPTAAAGTDGGQAKDSYYIGLSILSTEGDFLGGLSETVKERIEQKGHKFEVASADFNATKQIEQIENFISLGVDEVLVMAVDPSSLSDVTKKAAEKGIKLVAFSQKIPQYDAFLGADESDVGSAQAAMAAEWIDKNFPDAAPGSVEVAILENRDKPTAAERSEGLHKIAELSDKAKIVAAVGVDTSVKGGQAAAENLLLTNPGVKVVLCYNADTAMGVNAYATSMNSAIQDKAQFAAFSVDFNPAAGDAIKASAANESVWRGTIMIGESLDETYQKIADTSLAVLDGTLGEKDNYAAISKITADNVEGAGAH
jgi:ribose transport system substrate-binding protein